MWQVGKIITYLLLVWKLNIHGALPQFFQNSLPEWLLQRQIHLQKFKLQIIMSMHVKRVCHGQLSLLF
jgi:hypothetical protein